MFDPNLIEKLQNLSPKDDTHPTKIPHIWLKHISQMHHDWHWLVRFSNITLVLKGNHHAQIGKQDYLFKTGDVYFTSVNLPVFVPRQQGDFLSVHLQLDPKHILALSPQFEPTKPPQTAIRHSLPHISISPQMANCVERLLALLSDNPSSDFLVNLYLQEWYYWLMTSPLFSDLWALTKPNSPQAKIQKACLWIENHLNQGFKVANLAKQVHWGETQFYHYFKTITGMSPIAYQKSLRLNVARDLILKEKLSVSQVAYQVGYDNLSQFGREYKRMFGVSPSGDY